MWAHDPRRVAFEQPADGRWSVSLWPVRAVHTERADHARWTPRFSIDLRTRVSRAPPRQPPTNVTLRVQLARTHTELVV
jgi:hypothetical protein